MKLLLQESGYTAVTDSLTVQLCDILLGTGALLFGACPSLRSSGTGTTEGSGASPLASNTRLASRPHAFAENLHK